MKLQNTNNNALSIYLLLAVFLYFCISAYFAARRRCPGEDRFFF